MANVCLHFNCISEIASIVDVALCLHWTKFLKESRMDDVECELNSHWMMEKNDVNIYKQRFIFGFSSAKRNRPSNFHFPFATNDFRLRNECDQIPAELEQRIITMFILISFEMSFHVLAKLQNSIDTILPWNVQKIYASAIGMNVNVQYKVSIRRYLS